jgi:predicted CoA-binding protein
MVARERSLAMPGTDLLQSVVSASSDPNNPSAEEIKIIVETVHKVAVIGLSRDPSKAARRVPSYMAAKGYDIIPVNPNAERILGKRAYDCITDVAFPVDMVLIFRPSKQVAPFIRRAAGRPERPVIWLQEGIRDDDAAARAREQGIALVQDLCFFKVHRALTGLPRSSRRSPGHAPE